MKKLIKNLMLAAFVAFTPVYAGTAAKAPVIVPVVETYDFSAKFYGLSVIQDDGSYDAGGGIALEVPIVQNLKLELGGSIFENDIAFLSGNIVYYIPITDKFSVYTLIGSDLNLKTDEWQGGAGLGVQYSLSSRVNLFLDGKYNFRLNDSDDDGSTTVRLGLGFKF